MSRVPVAIFTPVYNGADYLAECIESVLAQTYQDWTYVIVNNHSDDGSGDIAEAFARKEPRIRVVHTARLLPLLENWNTMLRRHLDEKSRYAKIICADDWIYPECLERMVAVAERNPTVGLVSSFRTEGSEADRPHYEIRPHPHVLSFAGDVLSGKEACRMRLLTGKSLFGSPTSVLIRADLIRQREHFFNEANLRADAEAWFEVLQSTDLGFVKEVLTHTRTHLSSVTSSHWSLGTHMLGNYHLARRFAPEVFEPRETARVLRERTATYYMYLLSALLFGRWRTLRYHLRGLRKLGYGLEGAEVLRALGIMARHAAGAPGILWRGMRRGAPMEYYLSEFQKKIGYRWSSEGNAGPAQSALPHAPKIPDVGGPREVSVTGRDSS